MESSAPLRMRRGAVPGKRSGALPSPLGYPVSAGRNGRCSSWLSHLAEQADELRTRGSRVEPIFPDSSSRDAFGATLMDPSTRPPSARVGYSQGRALAERLTEFWR